MCDFEVGYNYGPLYMNTWMYSKSHLLAIEIELPKKCMYADTEENVHCVTLLLADRHSNFSHGKLGERRIKAFRDVS